MFAYTSVDGVAYEKLSTVTIVCWYMNGPAYSSRRNIFIRNPHPRLSNRWPHFTNVD